MRNLLLAISLLILGCNSKPQPPKEYVVEVSNIKEDCDWVYVPEFKVWTWKGDVLYLTGWASYWCDVKDTVTGHE